MDSINSIIKKSNNDPINKQNFKDKPKKIFLNTNFFHKHILFFSITISFYIIALLVESTQEKPYELYDMGSMYANNSFSHLSNATDYCSCDKKPNTCDPYCCCDPACNNYRNGTLQWMFFLQCHIDESESHRFPKCSYNDRIYNFKNLFSPIRIFTENYKSGMCVVFDNSKHNNSLHKNFTENDEFYMNNSIAFDSFLDKNEIANFSETYPYDKSFEDTVINCVFFPGAILSIF